jgi:hypothetical protein
MLDAEDESLRRPKYFGKYPAVVLDDHPLQGAHLGKVKVRVPAILEEDENGDPRPIEVVARPCWPPGFFFVPDDGAHVWVEFAAGDVDTPIWTGVWYPDDTPPHDADDNAPTEKQKVIRTSAGHIVTLDDDRETIVIQDKHGNRVTLAQGTVTISQDGGASIELSNNGDAVVAANSIKLGGSSASHGLLTDEAQVFLMTHQHVGNMGVLTGPPNVPPFQPTWFTTKTKAE